MKRNYKYFALVCASILTFGGCVEENLNIVTPAEVGDEIIFGARAGFENGDPDTKTIYSGVEYTYNGKKFERIDWLTKQMSGEGTDYDWYDMIEIHSPEAINGPTAHYEVNEDGNTPGADTQNQNGTHLKDYAYLLRSGNSGLQWGEGSTVTDDNGTTTGVHHFYAMYPSHKLFEGKDNTLYQGIKMDGTILTGIVPAAQAPERIEEDGNGNYVAVPNMKYAYMAARTTASRNDGNVALTFVPIVTAVEIELELSGDFLPEGSTGDVVPVSIGEIQVQGSGIAGTFTANLATEGENPWSKDNAYPTCINSENGTNSIQISMFNDGQALKLENGQTLTFTVFLRPGASVSDLTVRISPTGASYVSKKIQKTINPKVKTRIKNLYLPVQGVSIDAGNWMDQLDPNTELKRLSLPGTGGSFSYLYSDDDSGYYRSQNLEMTLEAQWNLGIRAFEIVSDRSQTSRRVGGWLSGYYVYTPSSLALEKITCNKQEVNKTIGDAVDEIHGLVSAEGSNECAVIIFTYQPESSTIERNAEMYASSLEKWYSSLAYKDDFVKYTPSVKLGDVAGKILVFVRLNQRNEISSKTLRKDSDIEEYYTDDFTKAAKVLENCPFVLIDGCGTAKDKWGARGYMINGNTAPDISNYSTAGNYMEYFMTDGIIDPSSHTTITKVDNNFEYKTEDPNVLCWYQEWARVIDKDITLSEKQWVDGQNRQTYSISWFESYSEKLNNIQDTFIAAISDLPEYANHLFVNSLCGYLATESTNNGVPYSLAPSIPSTNGYGVWGGAGGEVETLAKRINPTFYQFVLNAGLEQTTGPTGIILIDYVSSTPSNDLDGSYYLPGVIIANNFKYGSGNSNNTPGGQRPPQGGEGGI